jgi:nucleotide-binding universal stress UspA family protein
MTKKNEASTESFPVHRVLAAVDFSGSSRTALAFAIPLLAKWHAELHLVHVFPVDYPLSSLTALPIVVPEIEIERRVHAQLKDVAARHDVAVRHENIHAVRGTPFREICRLATELKIDLIVTATRGQAGLKHLALGSTAERVVRHASCPVLVIPHLERPSLHHSSFKKILAPVDFSDCAEAGLVGAKAIARQFGAEIVLLYSVDLHYYSTNSEFVLYDLPPLLKAAEKAGTEKLEELAEVASDDGIATEMILGNGHAGEQICQQAKSHNCDLIVIATHGRTGLSHVLLGSITEYVVRHAPCPVMVIPSRCRR